MKIIDADTGRTLSVFTKPGEDKRTPTTNTPSIFTFGDFSFDSADPERMTGSTRALQFNSFSTLERMNVLDWTPPVSTSVTNQELKLRTNDPLSYSYFSSFYSCVGNAINNIITEFPYGILSYDNGTGDTVFNYAATISGMSPISTFRIPVSAVTNQGGLVLNSGRTEDVSLVRDFRKFVVQANSGAEHRILAYQFIPPTGSTSFMELTIEGRLFSQGYTASTSQTSVYVKPNKVRINDYYNQLPRLEKQLWLNGGEFLIPSVQNPNVNVKQSFEWPKTIDGLNPDTYGTPFSGYLDTLLKAAVKVDECKTDVMVRTMIPENYIDNDQDGIYKGMVATYAKQFDELKQFIDGIAYAHTVNYEDVEAVPNKFMGKLGNLFGLDLGDSFSEVDLFEYLIGDVEENTSLSYYNIEIWKRLLINIVWLYKKKGTRDALQFIFKMIGAPDCLINLNEFVYDINRSLITNDQAASANTATFQLDKINENGYVNYDSTEYEFQEGGEGRGDGQAYINQWRPEFDPVKRNDNIKIQSGNSEYFGTQNIMNTKELDVNLSPATAIECDVFEYYRSTGTCWVWGTTGATFAFSGLNVPFEWLPTNCDAIDFGIISGMTFPQWIDYIYAVSVEPTNRKTIHQSHTSFHYQELKKLYLLYYLNTSPRSNRLNFWKLEAFINILEVQFDKYLFQFIPATTIFNGAGTMYKNTIFNRQKFVYREGINVGSEFQRPAPPNLFSEKIVATVNGGFPVGFKPNVHVVEMRSGIVGTIKLRPNLVQVVSNLPQQFNNSIAAVKTESTVKLDNFNLI